MSSIILHFLKIIFFGHSGQGKQKKIFSFPLYGRNTIKKPAPISARRGIFWHKKEPKNRVKSRLFGILSLLLFSADFSIDFYGMNWARFFYIMQSKILFFSDWKQAAKTGRKYQFWKILNLCYELLSFAKHGFFAEYRFIRVKRESDRISTLYHVKVQQQRRQMIG